MPDLIVPLDGSQLAERALPLAVQLARLTGSSLRLVQSVLSPASLEAGVAVEMLVEGAHDYLEQQAAKVRQEHGIAVSVHAGLAAAAELILAQATQPGVAAVVMSTHGRGGIRRLLMGSVAEGVLRDSPVPVYLVPAAAPETTVGGRMRRILVPLDGSALSYSVMAPVTELARAAHAQVTLLRVFNEEEDLAQASDRDTVRAIERQLDRLEDRAHHYFAPITSHLHAAGLKADSEWTTGVPAQEIQAMAQLAEPDLIALATHGRSGLDRLRYGSVAESVLRHARTPVMTFGPEALKRLAKDVGRLVDSKTPAAPASAL
jgi:nucleotide-binding universal stress UspA family protein